MGATKYVSAFEAMLLSLTACFTAPTRETFTALAVGWTLCLGRPTVTRIVRSAGSRARKHLSSYHRFFRTARWEANDLFLSFVTHILVPLVAAAGKIVLAGDDTTCSKFGRRVAFAGYFRDAVLSTPTRKVVRWAHTWVIVTMQVRVPFWPLRTVSFPVMARLYRKEADCDARHTFRTRGEFLVEMVRKLAERLPGREFELVADGAYPSKELVESLPRAARCANSSRPSNRSSGPPREVRKVPKSTVRMRAHTWVRDTSGGPRWLMSLCLSPISRSNLAPSVSTSTGAWRSLSSSLPGSSAGESWCRCGGLIESWSTWKARASGRRRSLSGALTRARRLSVN